MSRPPGGPSPADHDLVTRARNGDREAFRVLVERYEGRAYAIAFGLVGDREDAREIVQEAFLKAYRTLGGFRGDSSFYTWLYRIVVNLAIDARRKEHPSPLEAPDRLEDRDSPSPSDDAYRSELRAAILAAIDDLPPEQRAAIVLRELEGLSYAEIAEVEQVPIGTVMSRLFYARRKLQNALARYRGT
ncbi:MAG TPA: sigma-70 family RNA polymerase sigma factor [Thermodesulfobacteriota bacterium]